MTSNIHAVVVAFHGEDDLDRCIGSLARSVPVTVVDNSQSTAVRAVAGKHGAHYLDAGSNRGFGAGVNLALREMLKGPPVSVLLLNPDAEVQPDAVQALQAALILEPRAGAAAPAIIDQSGQRQRVMWPLPSPWRSVIDAIGLGRLNRSAEYAIGAVLLLRWEALQDVGLFDERFFLYAEEADWQHRARLRGWHTAFVGTAIAMHVGAATSTNARLREVLFHAGGETYMRKWHGGWGWQLVRTAGIVGASARGLLLRGHRRRQALSRAAILWRGPRKLAGFDHSDEP